MSLTIFPGTDGNVVGPNSATDGHLAVFDGVTGKLIKDGGAPAAGSVTAVSIATANGFSGSSTGGATPALTIVAGAITPTSFGIAVPLGADDTYRGMLVTGLVNLGGVTQWDVVYLNASSQWVIADANGSGTYPARGIAVATALTTVAVSVLTYGVVRNDAWSWTPGGALYLAIAAGGISQTAPVGSGEQVQQIGYAIDADNAFFDFSSTYITLV